MIESPYELDVDTALVARGDGRFAVHVTDRWNIGAAPNGGYLGVITTRAIAAMLPQPDPFSVTSHYLAVARPGPAEVVTEVVRLGKGHSTAEARLVQGGREIVRTLAVFGDLGTLEGPTDVRCRLPPLPAPEDCEEGRPAPSLPVIAERLDVFMPKGAASWMSGIRSEVPELGGWIRLRDGRAPDPISLVFFADAFPPPVLNLGAVQTPWVPTLEMTVHVRARPAPGLLRAWFRTRALMHGYLEEDGEIWDSTGTLVAMSRQLARVHRG